MLLVWGPSSFPPIKPWLWTGSPPVSPLLWWASFFFFSSSHYVPFLSKSIIFISPNRTACIDYRYRHTNRATKACRLKKTVTSCQTSSKWSFILCPHSCTLLLVSRINVTPLLSSPSPMPSLHLPHFFGPEPWSVSFLSTLKRSIDRL